MSGQQTFSNHRRFDPPYHFFLIPLFVAAVVAALYHLVRQPGLHHLLLAIAASAFLLLAFKVRLYAIRVQDRLIRLEETLRMQRLLPADLQGRIHELSPNQFVGLRFAADAELPDRVREALTERLSGEAIKKRIQTWRPDTLRV